ncbi:hypothetical protein E4T49_08560 [Aureobasidium sp. EXF-10728]|nr:hypothetical protein E4T49_08560 [Aureobasidium sp. EXF-10728]
MPSALNLVSTVSESRAMITRRSSPPSLSEERIATGIQKRRNDRNVNTCVRNGDIAVWHTFG